MKQLSSYVSEKETPKNSGGGVTYFVYKARNYSVAKALQDQNQSNRLNNVMCPFQLDGVERFHSLHNFQILAIYVLGV